VPSRSAKHALKIAAWLQTKARDLGMDSPPSATLCFTRAQDVLQFLSAFPDCAGYSQNRRGVAILDLADEARLQDLLYFMLKPAIPDLVPEQPVAGHTRQYTIQDFRSRALKLVLEAKRVRDKAHGKSVKAELHDDIGEYKLDLLCDSLIFFVYDPETFIESPSGLVKSVEGTHTHNGRKMQVYCIVQR
jgi:hypothetical protein